MATMRTSGVILGNIAEQLADNNAGLISAGDVRDNMEDIVFSINRIVASGDTTTEFPFFNDVKAKHNTVGGTGGTFIAESGITFPNSAVSTARQIEPFLGVGNLLHDSLGGLTAGDTHTQYVSISGYKSDREMTGNLAIGNNWIGASGNNSMGFKFAPNNAGTEDILTSGDLVFGDNSRINTGKSTAKAWINFDGSGTVSPPNPVVRSSYNVSGVQRTAQGKYTITFMSGVFQDNNYVAIGNSNATTASGSAEDFDVNTVGLVFRHGDGVVTPRTITYVCRNDAGEYVDSEMNDLVVFGLGPSVTADAWTPTVS
jgi:hypothetical protein